MCTLTSLSSSFFSSQNSIQCHSITFLKTLSKAFSRFTKRRHSFLSCSRYFSCNFLTMNKTSIVLLPEMKPNCISFSSNIEQMLFSRTLSTIFIDLKDSQFKTFFYRLSLRLFSNHLACLFYPTYFDKVSSSSPLQLHYLNFKIYFKNSGCHL